MDGDNRSVGSCSDWALISRSTCIANQSTFRAGINSLAVLVQETMALDPFAPAVFAFCNRRRDRMKLLFFDRSGFVLVLKRLTEDKFRWPRREVPVVLLTTEQLHWILDGIDIDAMIRHPALQYQIAG
ncbi:IS66 family insertion sequence element accessory protein TnpB [Rhizobium laguerreae]|uniref:IS66 family insertion sequence element accessory protein TnpB n=1 Tax=Rhizobium laguerreae TaxID=1076926 RepID=UPI001C904D5E|nr:IS66 family insertion sequence element accessory protein TnpB [Rhizobium laguerreae]MBY3517472.1 IS66 family insertion sequence element accessory protein TnpB [Rhizobium laguerreae]